MDNLSGVSLIFWCKRREERFVAKYVVRTTFEEKKTVEQALSLMPSYFYILSTKVVPNIGKLYAPSIFVEVSYSDLFINKHVMVNLEGLFPYTYEPTPGRETYKNTRFYKSLYVSDSYDDLDSITARTVFQNYIQINHIL